VAPTDGELLARWRASADRAALEQLIRRHGPMVLGVCRRVLGDSPEADDAFQATFLVLLGRAASLARPEQVAGWLHGVALRTARKARAARARRHGREVAMIEPVAPQAPEGDDDLRRILDEEIERLPERHRLPILLCELEGLTLDEAARRLGWPKGTVAGRLSRGREELRQRLRRRRCALVLLPVPCEVPESLVRATVEAAAAAPPRRWPVPLTLPLAAGAWGVGVALLTLAAGGLVAAWTAADPPPDEAPPAATKCHEHQEP
jgi:RNA polymerase sigma factor (sigma-70 family)